jgi:protein TonB
MSRLSIAFFLALFFHMLISVLPWPQESHTLPRPTGNESITINLTPALAEEKSEPSQPPSLQQDQVEKSSPTKMPVPETGMPKIPVPVAKPAHQVRETTVPKVLQLPTKKVVKVIQATSPPSDNPVASTLPTTPLKASSNAQEAPAASPAIIKARPLYDQNPKPPYPTLARRRGWQGVVILAVRVLADGNPDQLTIRTSSGHELLDKTALKTVKQWHFLPGTKNNVPTPMEVLVPVHFILQ